MKKRIEAVNKELDCFSPSNNDEIEQFRISMLGKKGQITALLNDFRDVPPSDKKEIGQLINILKNRTIELIENSKISYKNISPKSESIDLSLQQEFIELGSRHPISLVKNELFTIFQKLGFSLSEGPEIEDDWHVFSALNFPKEHPARDMQDTFFIEKNPDILLRTHTSSVQVRTMETQKLPIRVICPGRVFRNEAISARAHCIFHQVEGLYIDKGVSFADLKQTLLFFSRELFGPDTNIRLRPSFFPFTEPSAEMDVSCKLCGGKGCSVCKHTGWLEILGCGMVDPTVLELNGIDSKVYSGYAFGMGLERIAMLKYGVKDLRLYFENDIRFLNIFKNYL